MIIAEDIEPKSTFMARKRVSYIHKTCVKLLMCSIYQPSNDPALQACLFLLVYTVLFGVATGFLCKLLLSNSSSSSYFGIMIVPEKSKTYWFSYRWWRKRGELGAYMVTIFCKKIWLIAKYLSEWQGGFSSTWTWMEAFNVWSQVSSSSQPTSFSTKPLGQRLFPSSDPKISFLSEMLSDKL